MAPENTLAAFLLALQAGADGIELDVMLSRDKELVVIHDSTVDRTTDGSGKVAEMPLAPAGAGCRHALWRRIPRGKTAYAG